MKKRKKTLTKRLFLLVDKLYYRAQNHPKKLPEIMKGLTHVQDIPFEGEDGCRLDLLYRPREDGGKYPVIFEIHGGGFSAGDKAYRIYHCAEIARRTGAMVVNVNHPLGPEVTCPKPLQSLVGAFNWVIENAEKYDFDTDKMLVTGDSSGAYYAAMLAMIPDHSELQAVYGEMKGRFSSAAYLCGVFDIADSLKHRLPFGITTGVSIDLTGRKPKKVYEWELYPYLSPIDFVTPNHPPCLVIYAKKDFFAKGQAERMIEKLRASGVSCAEDYSTRFLDNHAYLLNQNSRAAVRSREVFYDYLIKFCSD